MRIFNISIPDKPLPNIELSTYAQELEIPHFRGVFMRDTLPLYPFSTIVNLNTSNQAGSRWVCYYRNKTDRIYVQRYLTTGSEFERGKKVIQRNADIVQAVNTSLWSSLLIRIEITNEW